MLESILLIGSTGKMNEQVQMAATFQGITVFRISRKQLVEADYLDFASVNLIVDFSLPVATRQVITMAISLKKPLLICSTGHSEMLKSDSEIPICYAPNTCLEWLYLRDCAQAIANANPNMQIVIDDIHTDTKVDKPSGTALELNKTLQNRATINSIRMPRLASWHTITFYDYDQIIRLEHQVLNRSVYARGAIRLGSKLIGMPPGVYSGFEMA